MSRNLHRVLVENQRPRGRTGYGALEKPSGQWRMEMRFAATRQGHGQRILTLFPSRLEHQSQGSLAKGQRKAQSSSTLARLCTRCWPESRGGAAFPACSSPSYGVPCPRRDRCPSRAPSACRMVGSRQKPQITCMGEQKLRDFHQLLSGEPSGRAPTHQGEAGQA